MPRWSAHLRRLLSSLEVTAKLGRVLGNFVLPPICAGCDQDVPTLPDTIPLCDACRQAFDPPRGEICPRCAAPAPTGTIRPTGCLHCESTSFRFHRIVALGVYEPPLEAFILRMKHIPYESLALAAGRMLADRIRAANWHPAPQLVTMIPMHWWRRIRRGTNSAAVLAEAVASELNLPLAFDVGRVTRIVPRQASLTPSRRRRNVRGAFAISPAYRLDGVHVLVIDDVLTTGATANAFAQALRLAGAATVSLGVIARGIGVR